MPITASKLRGDLYNQLEKVLTTGQPLEVELKGEPLVILPARKAGKLARLVPHDCLACDPEELIHRDWSGEWSDALP